MILGGFTTRPQMRKFFKASTTGRHISLSAFESPISADFELKIVLAEEFKLSFSR
jgi:hypothetical protein